ncbi:hypothetical protein [Seonamhaeicola marinus]|uniref:Uncharacterized protein n=1 Tax=Seonamhaeicola marinus TaxID=1912246 RepID=A0A5D0HSV0_9FLAO|nr:hypothetical protein [Seonamhaeicola marinus]TYA74345.1 hypothetical protein FUA24_13545 [Seonamhaeicola marinus]
MTRRLICIFFTVVFVAFLTAPTILTIIDNDIDVSVFYASPEEEEKGNEKNKDYEKLFFETPLTESTFAQKETEDHLEYVYKNYPKPHLNFIAPPPDLT